MHWIHTSQLLSLQYNMNRGKNSKQLSWEDFNPYEYQRKKTVAPTKLDSETLAKFSAFTNTLNNEKNSRP